MSKLFFSMSIALSRVLKEAMLEWGVKVPILTSKNIFALFILNLIHKSIINIKCT